MRYFGTDGVRGVAGVELTCELAFRLARAAGHAFRPNRALLAMDTRLSGPALAGACAAGLAETGCDVDLAGVLPSPAVSHLVPRRGYGLGLVVSASHNPPQDNGIKLYGPHGLKLSPEDEERVEALLDAPSGGGPLGAVRGWTGAEAEYAAILRAAVPDLSLRGVKVVLDCAHGATARLAPRLFAELGADVAVMGGEPDGARINETGAAAMAVLSREVPARGTEIGIAFDGDGDRALFVDNRGNVVEGDQLMAALAPHLLAWGELSSPGVVFTVLANLGAEAYLRERGFRVDRVPVGDRNVAWAMRERGVDLGGEPSGHVIFRHYTATGDGILTGLLVLRALARMGTDLASLVAPVPLYPQVRVDVPVADREAALARPAVQAAIREVQAQLDGRGRLVVRPSGTQPVIRIMVEGPDVGDLHALVSRIAGEIVQEVR
ncbi:phosphoglucosamine mutase [Candidatus Bipolaricaulota bacterium]|nr:phosphoglucosamine mutase [Candidatus Bipolaricaulota bacterium]